MSPARDYPFADLTDSEVHTLVTRSHVLRSYAAIEAAKAGWRRLLWLFAPAGRPWRTVFRAPPRFTADPPRAHC